MVDQVKENAITLVAEVVNKSISRAELTKDQISYLITHQPNMGLMQIWRETIGITAPRVFDTFDQYGNLFQGSIPITLSVLFESGNLKPDAKIALGTFSNRGDFASGMVLRV